MLIKAQADSGSVIIPYKAINRRFTTFMEAFYNKLCILGALNIIWQELNTFIV